jgi:lipopolysaccharide transport system ATP-binding protein
MSSDSVTTDPVTPPPIAIEAHGLGKAYAIYERPEHRLWQLLFGRWRRFHSEFKAVRDVDLSVVRGETVGIVGRNGSGKSTLLKMVSGILTPTEGSLEVRGHVAPILALGVGFNPDFTGRENVRMSAALLGIPQESLDAGLEDLIAFADIGDFFDRPVRTYSSGMCSRLAFAVAIHANPEILVIDEILAVGDEAFARKCFARIEALKANGSTILFVSHASNLVVQLCDRAILMEAGQSVLSGDPKSVISFYHKLLYAAPDARMDVLREIRAEDALEHPPADPPSEEKTKSFPAPDAEEKAESTIDLGRFDPELRPESTVEYPSLGVTIVAPRIMNSREQAVNVLRSGQSYRYAYEVEFDDDAFGVRFGMMVKTITGFELGGQASHPWGRGLEVVEAGSCVRVRFHFQPLLAPGVYFLNAGVLGLREQGETYLHRILDAVMFRVEADASSLATGQVDLRAAPGTEVVIEAPQKASQHRA